MQQDWRETVGGDKRLTDGQRRRALLLLAGIGVLLFVLASAHVCTDEIHDMNLQGDYWGVVGTGAGPPPSEPTNNPMLTVYARTKGEEFCNFWGQEDWEVEDSLSRDSPEVWALVIVADGGGYATGDRDCIWGFGHAIYWFWDHKWWNVHGEDGEERDNYCINFGSGPCV